MKSVAGPSMTLGAFVDMSVYRFVDDTAWYGSFQASCSAAGASGCGGRCESAVFGSAADSSTMEQSLGRGEADWRHGG